MNMFRVCMVAIFISCVLMLIYSFVCGCSICEFKDGSNCNLGVLTERILLFAFTIVSSWLFFFSKEEDF